VTDHKQNKKRVEKHFNCRQSDTRLCDYSLVKTKIGKNEI